MAADAPFELMTINGALVGVHSSSRDAPLKTAQFPQRYAQFAGAQTYADWQFVFVPSGFSAAGGQP